MSPHRATATITAILLLVPLTAPAPPSGLEAQETDDAADEPRILILGSSHLAQDEGAWDPELVRDAVDALTRYRPDMVVVEHLPADWPRGRGRDYRPGFDLERFARRWEMPLPGDAHDGDTAVPSTPAAPGTVAAGSRREGRAPSAVADPCLQARRHFLRRDLANAAYVFLTDGVQCEVEGHPAIVEWLGHWRRHEMARIAFPVARARGLGGVVSFDYQGEDARWFLGLDLLERIRAEGTPEQRAEADSVERAIMAFRKRNDRIEEDADFLDMLRYRNSQRWIEAQRRIYEEVLPVLGYEDAGARQTENYWLRNRRMFDRIDEAAARRDARRILVVVGAGHKYFLDELARERGYRWVDPLDYLGREAPQVGRAGR